MPADPIITVEHLTAGYEGNVLMQDINFSVRRGEVFIILAGRAAARARCSST
jgi:phospholipid/cholesterol/gamma-HCH transport system ATP-binding protein